MSAPSQGEAAGPRAPLPVAVQELASFDGTVRMRQDVVRPDRYRQLELLDAGRRRITRGGGYSYAAAGFGAAGGLVQDGRAFDRILAFDGSEGILECEAGTTLGAIHALATPRGWYLPVQPGYPLITIGGCIAADVHGKNQYGDGNFHGLVRSLKLFHPDRGTVEVRSGQGSDLFELTCGGFGLTGHIVSARLQLSRLPGTRVGLRRVAIPRFEATRDLLEEHAPGSPFVYTWHDFTARGDAFGRGFLYTGDFRTEDGTRTARGTERVARVDAETRGRWRPAFFNGTSTRAFNSAYARWQSAAPAIREISLFEFLFPVARKMVYFELFGAAGFREYQMLIPGEAFPSCAASLRSYLERQPTPVTLASCKLFRGRSRYLRFDGDGVCLALDTPRGASGERLFAFLDSMVADLGGRPNLIKDSRLSKEMVRKTCPEYETFREGLRRFDPERLFASELSERLGL